MDGHPSILGQVHRQAEFQVLRRKILLEKEYNIHPIITGVSKNSK